MAPQVWFITGASKGLGAAITEHALKRGDEVVATARNTTTLQKFVDTYGEDKVLTLKLDVNNYDEAQSTINQAFDKFGRIDLLINNAGYADFLTVEDSPIDIFRAQIDTNLMGVVNVTKAALPYLRKQGSGHIFQVSSIGGRIGTPGFSAYQAAKWAVGGFSSVLSQEVAPFGIKVTVLEPGAMPTDWATTALADKAKISEPYVPHVKPVYDMFTTFIGHVGADLDKIAQIIVKVYETKAEEVPLKLLIGGDAVDNGAKVAKVTKETDDKWREVSLSADTKDAKKW